MSVVLARLLEALPPGTDPVLDGDPGTEVTEVVTDSRRIPKGALFVALRGDRTDGHRFVADAVQGGAAALLVEEPPGPLPCLVPWVRVPDTRRALAALAARFWGNPGDRLTLVGVTGTNGKTSTVRMLESILRCDGREAASLGTVSVRYAGREHPAALTTPEADSLQRTLARMVDAGVEAVAMEVSSHALARHRVATLGFEAATFTNLTQDHLDFHGDMEAYARAKHTLFGPDHLRGPAVVNAADPVGASIAATVRARGGAVTTFGRGADARADVRTVEERVDLEGSRLVVEAGRTRHEYRVALPGDFQVENALAAIATAVALDLSPEAVREGLAVCPPVPGRMERVSPERPVVLVDYAHTPDALDRLLGRLRPLVAARLITVFGCGGDRDRAKRAPMARAACRHSDRVIATSDNPRTEDPDEILRDVAQGLSGAREIVPDRRRAIRSAVSLANDDDVVVIAGKGHETVQIVGGERLPFDDREEAREALRERGRSR